jgi:hypothetical protein
VRHSPATVGDWAARSMDRKVPTSLLVRLITPMVAGNLSRLNGRHRTNEVLVDAEA